MASQLQFFGMQAKINLLSLFLVILSQNSFAGEESIAAKRKALTTIRGFAKDELKVWNGSESGKRVLRKLNFIHIGEEQRIGASAVETIKGISSSSQFSPEDNAINLEPSINVHPHKVSVGLESKNQAIKINSQMRTYGEKRGRGISSISTRQLGFQTTYAKEFKSDHWKVEIQREIIPGLTAVVNQDQNEVKSVQLNYGFSF